MENSNFGYGHGLHLLWKHPLNPWLLWWPRSSPPLEASSPLLATLLTNGLHLLWKHPLHPWLHWWPSSSPPLEASSPILATLMTAAFTSSGSILSTPGYPDDRHNHLLWKHPLQPWLPWWLLFLPTPEASSPPLASLMTAVFHLLFFYHITHGPIFAWNWVWWVLLTYKKFLF